MRQLFYLSVHFLISAILASEVHAATTTTTKTVNTPAGPKQVTTTTTTKTVNTPAGPKQVTTTTSGPPSGGGAKTTSTTKTVNTPAGPKQVTVPSGGGGSSGGSSSGGSKPSGSTSGGSSSGGSSSGGGSSGGSSSGGGSSGGGTKTVNTPAGPKQVTVNSSSKSGLTNLGKNLLEAAKKSALAKAATNVANTVAKTIVNSGTKVAAVAKEIVRPHYTAIQAGLQAQRNSIRGTSGVSSYGARVVMERAYYNAVRKSYLDQGIPEELQAVPTGPLMAAARKTYDLRFVRPETLAKIKEIDSLYRDDAALVVLPGTINATNALQIVGPVYNEMNPLQKLGLVNSVYVSVYSDPNAVDAGYNERIMSDLAKGGIVVVDTNPKNSVYETTTLHELQHAGDYAVYNLATAIRNNPKSTPAEKEMARRTIAAAVAAGAFPGADIAWSSNLEDVETPGALAYSDYYDLITELRAFSNESADMADLKRGIAISWNAANRPSRNYPGEMMTPAKAEEVINMILDSPTLKAIDKELTNFAVEQLK